MNEASDSEKQREPLQVAHEFENHYLSLKKAVQHDARQASNCSQVSRPVRRRMCGECDQDVSDQDDVRWCCQCEYNVCSECFEKTHHRDKGFPIYFRKHKTIASEKPMADSGSDDDEGPSKKKFAFDYELFFRQHIIDWYYMPRKAELRRKPIKFLEVKESVGGGSTQTGKVRSTFLHVNNVGNQKLTLIFEYESADSAEGCIGYSRQNHGCSYCCGHDDYSQP